MWFEEETRDNGLKYTYRCKEQNGEIVKEVVAIHMTRKPRFV